MCIIQNTENYENENYEGENYKFMVHARSEEYEQSSVIFLRASVCRIKYIVKKGQF